VSTVALIVIVLVVVLLVAMLIAGLRRSAARRGTRAAAVDYHREPFRSHAEASRHEPEESRT
jgi:hypothetical protein